MNETYPDDLPLTSIIICYYNEAPSALIRMVNSILDRTPSNLIQEIILVDDSSDSGEKLFEIYYVSPSIFIFVLPVVNLLAEKVTEKFTIYNFKISFSFDFH